MTRAYKEYKQQEENNYLYKLRSYQLKQEGGVRLEVLPLQCQKTKEYKVVVVVVWRKVTKYTISYAEKYIPSDNNSNNSSKNNNNNKNNISSPTLTVRNRPRNKHNSSTELFTYCNAVQMSS